MVPTVKDNKVGFEYIDGRFFVPTEYAWSKVMVWLGMPSHFIRFMSEDIPHEKDADRSLTRGAIDRELCLHMLRRHLKVAGMDKEYMFRTYDDGTMRTMVSDQYAVIDNGWYLETLQSLFKSMNVQEEPRLSHWRGDEDTIYGNLLIPDTVREEPDSDYGGMLSLSNCEIGRRSWSQYPSVFRAICCNGCIWDRESGDIIKRRHRGKIVLDDLRSALLTNLNTQIPLLASGIDQFLAMKDKKVELPLKNIFATIGMLGKFSFGLKGQVNKIVEEFTEHEMENVNAFGVVNAITRAGQAYDPSEWVRFDEFAGQLISTNLWDKVTNNAKSVTAKELEKVFGTAS